MFTDICELHRSKWITGILQRDMAPIVSIYFGDVNVQLYRDIVPFLEYVQRGGELPVCTGRIHRMIKRLFDFE